MNDCIMHYNAASRHCNPRVLPCISWHSTDSRHTTSRGHTLKILHQFGRIENCEIGMFLAMYRLLDTRASGDER